MAINSDVITLSKKDIEGIIDKECQRRLSMSLEEFKKQRKRGHLPESLAVHDIEALLRFANGKSK
jgi:hypothetical protein